MYQVCVKKNNTRASGVVAHVSGKEVSASCVSDRAMSYFCGGWLWREGALVSLNIQW